MKYQILHGDNRETLKTLPDNSIDAIVTDPPYGIDFLGKSWDANTGAVETYQECLRVLKPGGHIVAFSAARTYHHLAVTLEAAGFEIRDQIMWIYSSGFPKSQDIGKSIDRAAGKKDPNYGTNKASVVTTAEGRSESTYVRCKICNKGLNGNTANDCDKNPCGLKYAYQTEDGKAWSGWGTQLKPAHEPICLARKPIKVGSIARNCQTWGVGALNIDATRIEGLTEKELNWTPQRQQAEDTTEIGTFGASGLIGQEVAMYNDKGRFPSNVIGEIPDYQKYFYCPKVSRKERHIGHELPAAEPLNSPDQVRNHPLWDPSIGTNAHRLKEKIRTEDKKGNGLDRICETCGVSIMKPQDCHCPTKSWVRPIKTGNNHPTVKPIELMKYLIKLITPPGGTVLDPFNGSGSTGCAAVELGHEYIGCELDERYVEIAKKRIEAWYQECNPTMYNELFGT